MLYETDIVQCILGLTYWLEHHTHRPVCLGIKGGLIG